ncbi:MAG: dTDP-4-dehydrorhamnose reductase [Deltaproteobacteria bacterium]|nr:dTDP-4-dehydrorhamnose reductase [Deltaproteobacteria bacterium]
MDLRGSKILLVGACGMLAGHLIPQLKRRQADLVYADIRRIDGFSEECLPLDMTNLEQVHRLVAQVKPQVIINCAAYTAVDDAEDKIELALRVNAIGPKNLAQAARDCGATLVHISSDYVYGGLGHIDRPRTPYLEDEEVSPCGIYGHSKWLGDEFIKAILPAQHLILRTSWLHGLYGPNFVATIVRVAREKHELRVVNDQIGSPTWAEWLAVTICELLGKKCLGIFHASSHGDISWYDFAKEIVRQSGLATKVLPQITAEAKRKAPRPPYSTMNVSKLENALGHACPSWQDGLAAHLESIKAL